MGEDDWTISTLREHLTLLLQRLEHEFHSHLDQVTEETKAALAASDKAISKAEAATEKALDKVAKEIDTRFSGVNEFRKALSDQTATFVPRKEIEGMVSRAEEKINVLSGVVRALVPRAEVESAHARTDDQIRNLNDRLTRIEGSKQGVNAAYIALLGLVGAMGTVVAVLLAFR